MTSFVLLKSEASTDLFDKCLIFFFSFLLTITRAQGAYPQILSSQWKSTLIVLTDVVVKQCRANNTVPGFSVIFHRINYEVPNPSSYMYQHRFLEFYKRYKIQKWPLKSNAILWNLGIFKWLDKVTIYWWCLPLNLQCLLAQFQFPAPVGRHQWRSLDCGCVQHHSTGSSWLLSP